MPDAEVDECQPPLAANMGQGRPSVTQQEIRGLHFICYINFTSDTKCTTAVFRDLILGSEVDLL